MERINNYENHNNDFDFNRNEFSLDYYGKLGEDKKIEIFFIF